MTDPLYLLDSNICIYVLADSAGAAAQRLAAQSEGTVVTSAIVFAEVQRGLPQTDASAQAAAAAMFKSVPVLPFDAAAGARYASVPFRRARYDSLIAAHALSLGLTLITNNERDFADIPGLRVENWTL
ncbi:type II toxin-antitoxin system VapC family toxin [Sphingomonas hengshuiensis]|uniref:Ribonuclease VapC n=1 Tax=Sphingomonas hengshuiensis TaxID=1609977 RepID=A0A7U4J881_9SPHN|nr:type II toxin-antitoxin system VapC family toxin [Sphingomonas hengshuiensis]AJP71947.1 twitching motility protein PilT [Sphingomonas hengshuiensis]